jgi:hypothetical protein
VNMFTPEQAAERAREAAAEDDTIDPVVYAATLAQAGGIVLDRASLEAWAGRALTDADVATLARDLPFSSVPTAIATMTLTETL